MAEPKSWVQVVGYRHEVLHTGVLADLLDSRDGPSVAEGLTHQEPGSVGTVNEVKLESKLLGARGKADLTARMELVRGDLMCLAVETKVHSDGSRDQLERTTEGPDDSEGVLLALGLTSLKLLTRDTAQVSDVAGAPWHRIGPSDWLQILDGVSDRERPWLPDYKASLASWTKFLDPRQKNELPHLRWMNRLLQALPDSDRWREIKTSQSGPLLSRFDWSEAPDKDIYLEFMGLHDKRRVLCVKVGGGTPDEIDELSERLGESLRKLRAFQLGGRRGGRSRTVAVTSPLGDETTMAVNAVTEAINVLDELFVR